MTAPADAVDPDGLRRARLAAALFEQAPAALGAFSADGAELVTNASYRALRERGLTPVPQAPREREVALDDGAYLALRFPLDPEDAAEPVQTSGRAEGLPWDDDRERAAYGEVLLDISQRRLRAVSAALAELEQLKSDLVSTVSHELRTPLSSILGYCELLGDGEFGELDPGVRQMIDVIARNSRRLSRLLEDLLLLAQLDAPCPPPAAWARCDLVELVTSVAGSVSARARAAGLAVEVDLPREAVWVDADQAQLRHALTNLATNAVKFSAASGTVRFRLAVDGTDAILEVIDDGMGIDPEDLPRLGDRFYRTAAARDQQVQGAGIGLSVVQSVAHRHRGELELCSRPGEGTTARLRLPLRNGSRS